MGAGGGGRRIGARMACRISHQPDLGGEPDAAILDLIGGPQDFLLPALLSLSASPPAPPPHARRPTRNDI